MKTLLCFLVSSVLFLFSCGKDEDENYEPFLGSYNNGSCLSIMITDGKGNDIFNPSTIGSISEKDIYVDYEYDKSNDKCFSVTQTEQGNVLRVYLELPNINAIHYSMGKNIDTIYYTNTYIRFGKKKAKNLLKAEYHIFVDKKFFFGNNSCILTNIYFNNTLLWDREKMEDKNIIPTLVVE